MSQAALLRSTYEILRSTIPGMVPSRIGVHKDGQPPAGNGQPIYLAIHPDGWLPGPSEDIHEATEEQFGIGLTITMRTSVIPRDKWGEWAYLKQVNSIETAAREVFHAMHKYRYDLIIRANEYSGAEQTMEPLEFQGAPLIPQEVMADWFHGEPEDTGDTAVFHAKKGHGHMLAAELLESGAARPLEPHGLILEMKYFGARRICPSEITDQWIRVAFQTTRDTTPEVRGTYGGNPDSVVITYAGSDYTPTLNAGHWSLPAGTITFPLGSHDIQAAATYETGAVLVTDNTIDEITILDPSNDWLWADGTFHQWSDGGRAVWSNL